MPPNSSCAKQPHAIVPLPSLAIETLPTTGNGLPGPTGIETPSTTSAAAYTGTGLLPVSGCVAIGGVVVLLSSTGSVIAHLFRARQTRDPIVAHQFSQRWPGAPRVLIGAPFRRGPVHPRLNRNLIGSRTNCQFINI